MYQQLQENVLSLCSTKSRFSREDPVHMVAKLEVPFIDFVAWVCSASCANILDLVAYSREHTLIQYSDYIPTIHTIPS